ncbi:uncharacterized protein RSE6_13921 [Rhynchosporium secalis]|uniref:Uncharacterized protein n=1 Tax=Rhynchosporium secalis TaxID=38038 RepID=A0A1E1MU14_RHYSE|nr:uncharacterized protein RSE6_13921 [Rhynchosporium secalis]
MSDKEIDWRLRWGTYVMYLVRYEAALGTVKRRSISSHDFHLISSHLISIIVSRVWMYGGYPSLFAYPVLYGVLKYNRADHRRTGPEPIKCRRRPKHMNQCHSNSDSIPRLGGHHHHHHHHTITITITITITGSLEINIIHNAVPLPLPAFPLHHGVKTYT